MTELFELLLLVSKCYEPDNFDIMKALAGWHSQVVLE